MTATDDPKAFPGPHVSGLTEKQRLFADALHSGAEKYQAYADAGYEAGNKKAAGVNICRLLSSEKIQQYLADLARHNFKPADGEDTPAWYADQMLRLANRKGTTSAQVRAMELAARANGQDWGGTGDDGSRLAKMPAIQLIALVQTGIGGVEGQEAARKISARLGVAMPPTIEGTAVQVDGVPDGETVQ